MRISKNDFMKSVGFIQLCAGQRSGEEAAIHAMHDIFDDNKTEVVLFLNTENAFNTINRKAMMSSDSNICEKLL